MRPANDTEIYLHVLPVDFRKSINGLAAIVEKDLQLDLFKPSSFVFCNRQRDKVKLLYWDKNGFCLWYKRLEKHKFKWPRNNDNDCLHLSGEQINWLLDGFDIFTHPPHELLKYNSIS